MYHTHQLEVFSSIAPSFPWPHHCHHSTLSPSSSLNHYANYLPFSHPPWANLDTKLESLWTAKFTLCSTCTHAHQAGVFSPISHLPFLASSPSPLSSTTITTTQPLCKISSILSPLMGQPKPKDWALWTAKLILSLALYLHSSTCSLLTYSSPPFLSLITITTQLYHHHHLTTMQVISHSLTHHGAT